MLYLLKPIMKIPVFMTLEPNSIFFSIGLNMSLSVDQFCFMNL